MDIEQYINELRCTVITAGLNHEIWWVYKSKDTRPQYIEAMNRYSLFFSTSIHAHFVATLVALYQLYETRHDTYNIPTLLRSLKEGKTLSQDKLKSLDDQYHSAKLVWKKVTILRNKYFGHRSTTHTLEDVFKEASVTPNELGDLVNKTKILLNELSQAWNGDTHAFNLEARQDIIQLLDDLKMI